MVGRLGEGEDLQIPEICPPRHQQFALEDLLRGHRPGKAQRFPGRCIGLR